MPAAAKRARALEVTGRRSHSRSQATIEPKSAGWEVMVSARSRAAWSLGR